MAAGLQTACPWTKAPVIINAPMGGFAGHALASAVSVAGGIGMIGAVFDMNELSENLTSARETLAAHIEKSDPWHPANSPILPLGVGLLPFVANIDTAMPVIAQHKPAILWLFAAKELSDYAAWRTRLRAASPDTQLWVQVGSVSAALEVARTAAPDVLVMQGADAGGHGFARGAGIVSLLPEASDALVAAGLGHVPLVAAGGIAEGRGVASAVALGAAGAVMGTRFLAAEETMMHPAYRAAVLGARDGAVSTARAHVFDELRGPNIWPPLYDGRALTTESYADWKQGVDIEQIRTRCKEAAAGEDAGYSSRVAVWAGAGVGLVNKVLPAAQIVQEVRDAATDALRNALSKIGSHASRDS
ncbi:inosine monophosphate dehydrogenase [Xylariaceae sp. FL0016]|nr:inosine monophosphate dehydrogenase [Xylariaceae sp. FL0016]